MKRKLLWLFLVAALGIKGWSQPAISSVYVSASTSTTATIVWTTNVAATSQVKYGFDNTIPFSNNTNFTLVTSHSMTLTLLNASQPYYFAVVSTASGLSSQSSTQEFALCGTGPVPVSGTINKFYGYGTFSMAWNAPSGASATPMICGVPVTQTVSGNLDANGSISSSVADAMKVTPGPGTWTVHAADMGNLSPVSITTSISAVTNDLSAPLQAAAVSAGLVGCLTNTNTNQTYPASCATGAPPSSTVNVNGAPVNNVNFNSASPSPDANFAASTFKVLGSNVIVETPYGSASTFGLLKVDGTTCTATAGVLTCPGGGGGGITINGQTGPSYTFQSSGGTVGITTPSPNVINFEAVGGGGGGSPSSPATSVQIANAGVNGFDSDPAITVDKVAHTMNFGGALPAARARVMALSPPPATWTFDIQTPTTARASILSLTTLGSGGPASLIGTVLNIPNYAGGSTTNALTMNNSGSGNVSGSTFDGSVTKTISYNTIGAAPTVSPALTGTPTAPTAVLGTSTTQLATTAFVQAAVGAAGSRQWSCQTGLGDGVNAMPAATYLQTTCKNFTGSTVTISGIQCFADTGTNTLNVTNSAGTSLLTTAIVCSSSFAAGTQSATVTLASGDSLKFTFAADGTSKQSTWGVYGTF